MILVMVYFLLLHLSLITCADWKSYKYCDDSAENKMLNITTTFTVKRKSHTNTYRSQIHLHRIDQALAYTMQSLRA